MENRSYQSGYTEGFKNGYETAMIQVKEAIDPKVSIRGSIERLRRLVRGRDEKA